MNIIKNLETVLKEIPAHVKLVAVSKMHTAEEVLVIYNAGQKIFGENKVQELLGKVDILPKDIEWHLIGHLQTNKVKYIASSISIIQSIDSLKLLKIVNAEARKFNRKVDCLLQVHIATEETKFGFSEDELYELLQKENLSDLNNIRISGLMGMATYTDDKKLIRSEFRKLAGLFNSLKNKEMSEYSEFKEISMGMSSDYAIAIEEGSTIVRVGTKIFGERHYS